MAANVINQITAANTFQQWLGATQQLIGTANALTNGNGSTFYANTNLIVGGVNGSNATLNVETSAIINTLTGNTANVINVTFRSVQITENIATANITTDLNVGANTYIHDKLTVGGDTLISGNLVVTGNLVLDEIGFDDLIVSGSGSFGNTLTVIGNTSLTNVTVSDTLTVLNADITTLVGTANSNIYAAIAAADASALAYSIALG